jgi:hypothetical protein
MGLWGSIKNIASDVGQGVKNYGYQLDPFSEKFDPWAAAATIGSAGIAAPFLAAGNGVANALEQGEVRGEQAGADAQTQAQQGAMDAIDKTIASNRSDVSGPFGTTDWTKNADGTWGMKQGFSGPMQGSTDAMGRQLADAWGSPMMTGETARTQAIDAAFGQAKSRLDPMFDQREQKMKTQLANQGLDPTSEAYATALGNFGRERNDAFGSAMNGAIAQGTAAGNSIFQQDQQRRMAPLQAMGAAKNLLPGQGGASGGNYMGAFEAGQDAKDALAKQDAGTWGAIAQLGMTGAAAFSDERLKTNIIREEAHALPGVPYATWEYLAWPGRRYRGVIAQDLEKVAPELVLKTPDGIRLVNYAGLPPGTFREVPDAR